MNSKILTVLIAVLVAVLGLRYLWGSTQAVPNSAEVSITKARYVCPMHPGIKADKPGRCPICGMDLDPVKDPQPEATSAQTPDAKILYYRDPMGKNRTSPVPAKDEMGMDFIPVYEHESLRSAGVETVDGRAAFSIPRDTQQRIGVTTGSAKREELKREIRASGKVAYEPELYQAIEEYRIALKSARVGLDGQGSSESPLILSGKTKLKLLGISDAQLQKIAGGEIGAKEFLLPKGKAWIYADIFESEIRLVTEGQECEVSVVAYPNELFHGQVSSISPLVDPTSRTIKVRIEIDDPKRLLKPEMFAVATLKVDLGNRIVIPQSAVTYTGTKTLVYVVSDSGQFEPREILLGESSNDKQAVSDGLHEGDVVVTSANFLVDSESRIRGIVARAPVSAGTP